MNHHQKNAELRFELAMKRAERRSSLASWRESIRCVDVSDSASVIRNLANALEPLYQYFAKAQNPRSMGMRAWCLLYAVRPDLIDFATIQKGAEFFGVTQEAMCYQLKQLESSFPGFEYTRRALPTNDLLKERLQKWRSAGQQRLRSRRVSEAA